MATIIHDAFGGSGDPVGRTPDTVDNGNVWAESVNETAAWNVQTGYCGLNASGGDLTGSNPLVVDCATADVVVTARVWQKGGFGANNRCGVALRFTDEGETLAVYMYYGGVGAGALGIYKIEGDTETLLQETATLTIAAETAYDLIVTANGTAISADLYTTGAVLVGSVSTTSSFNLTETKHGLTAKNSSSYGSRVYDILIAEAASLGGTVGPNGFDVTVTATSETVGNYAVKAGGLGSEASKTIQSATRISATQVRLRLANGSRILSTDASVLVSDTAQGITDEAATNSSVQTSTTVAVPCPNGGYVVHTFAAAPTVGILAAGDLTVTNAVALNSVAYTAGTAEEQYTIHGSVLNPECGPAAEHPYHPDSTGYNAATAASYPLTLTADDCLLTAVALPALDTHATSTAFSLGDAIAESGRYWRCTTAGTTAASKPSFPSSGVTTVSDGTAVWTPGGTNGTGDDGTSLVRKMVVLHCSGATLKSQDTYRSAFTSGATKTYWTRADVTGTIPGDSLGYTDVSGALDRCKWFYNNIGRDNTTSQIVGPEESFGTEVLYGQNFVTNSSIAVLTLMSGQSYDDVLLDSVVQRGIDEIGMREGGGFWRGNGGHGQGQLVHAFAAIGLLEDATLLDLIRTNANTTDDWDGTELNNQVFYVTAADIAATHATSGYDYGSGGGTNIDPAQLPSTYSDSPANAYFPATVQDTWLHVPEWGIEHGDNTNKDDPRWGAGSTYRRLTAAVWAGQAYILGAFGLIDSVDAPLFFDYMDRYELLQGPDGVNANWSFDDAWTAYEADRAAYAITSWTAVGTAVSVSFNRYTTGTAAGFAAAIAISGGITVSGGTQTGPRTWSFTASAAPASGATLTYTAASGDAVDAGNNALGDQTSIPGFAITSITPNPITVGASGTWTVTGTGFVDGITPTVDGGVTLGATIFNSSTEIEVDYAPATTAGDWVLTLTNPDGQNADGDFTVTAAGGDIELHTRSAREFRSSRSARSL